MKAPGHFGHFPSLDQCPILITGGASGIGAAMVEQFALQGAKVDATPNLIWQLLTKRPHRYKRHLPERSQHANVWLGATAENQQFYDVRWRILSEFRRAPGWENTPLWISYEPAIGPVTMRGFDLKPDWIIFGGESGSRRRRWMLLGQKPSRANVRSLIARFS